MLYVNALLNNGWEYAANGNDVALMSSNTILMPTADARRELCGCGLLLGFPCGRLLLILLTLGL